MITFFIALALLIGGYLVYSFYFARMLHGIHKESINKDTIK